MPFLLQLLGGVSLKGPSGLLSGYVTQPRQLALLALLATAGEDGLSRDKVIACLWPDSNSRSARHSLTDTLYRVRKELGSDAIEVHATTVRLDPDVIRADVAEFERAYRSGDLEAAVGHYHGALLDGFHLKESVEFEQWREREARRLQRQFESALGTLAGRSEARGDRAGEIVWLRRLLTLDPYNSHVVVQLMEAHAALGDPANAVKLAAEHTALLAEELDVEPPTELVDLAMRLHARAGQTQPARTNRPFPFGAQLSEAPRTDGTFVGRESELARLHSLLDAARAGDGRVIFIAGEAGTGKTALATAFCHQSLHRVPDLVVANGNCTAHTGTGDPYLPFREILDLLSGGIEGRCSAGAITLEQAQRLWDLAPVTAHNLTTTARGLIDTFIDRADLVDRVGTGSENTEWLADLAALGTPHATGPAAMPQPPLFNQYVRLIQTLSRTAPLLLIVDDLQWADNGSISLLFQLGRRLSGHRILVVGLFRPSDIAMGRDGRRHPIDPVIHELQQAFGNVEIALEAGSRAFVDALIDTEPNALDASFRNALFEQTQGHALFTVELLRGMRDVGMLARDKGGWRTTELLDWSLVPARIQPLLAERIGRLPAELQQIMSVASVEGETFTLEVLATVTGIPPEDLLPRISRELDRRFRLVRAVDIERVAGRRISRFRFRHVLFQRYLYERLDRVERSHLHERVGLALEALRDDTFETFTIQLAHHFAEAGSAFRAARYSFEAGVHAGRAAALPEAIAHLETALRYLETLPRDPETDRLELSILVELGNARSFAALPEQLEPFVRARGLAERLGEDRLLFRVLSGLYLTKGHYPGDNEIGRQLALEALAVADRIGDDNLLAFAHESVGRVSYMRGEYRTALTHYNELLRLYNPAAASRWCDIFLDIGCSAEGSVGLVKGPLGFPDQARAHTLSATSRADETVNPLTFVAVLWWDLLLLMNLRDSPAVLERSQVLAESAVRLGLSPYWSPIAAVAHGWSLGQTGDIQAGIDATSTALADYLAVGWEVGKRYFTALLAELLGMGDRADEGLRLIEETTHLATERKELFMEAEVQRILGDLHLARSVPDIAAAEKNYRAAVEIAREQETKLLELRATTSLTRLLLPQGRLGEVRPMLARVYAWFTEGFDTPDLKDAKALLDQSA